MSDNSAKNAQTPPPAGDSQKAEYYISKLIPLISRDKVTVFNTDLSLYDPTTLQTHYRIDLEQFQIEVSHSKQADNGRDNYVLLFNNLKLIREGCNEKVILAYLHLDENQFTSFKNAAEEQLARRKKEEEAKRFNEAVAPVEQVLDNISEGRQQELEQPSSENSETQEEPELKDDISYLANDEEKSNPEEEASQNPFATV